MGKSFVKQHLDVTLKYLTRKLRVRRRLKMSNQINKRSKRTGFLNRYREQVRILLTALGKEVGYIRGGTLERRGFIIIETHK